jgi:hypothetical protein
MLRQGLLIATLSAAEIVLHATGAIAQCAARDAPQNVATPRASPANTPSTVPKTDVVLNVWKTVTLGEFANSFALRNALDAAGCGVGDLGEEILARPAFTLASSQTGIDLVVVSAAALGIAGLSASLRDIYSRAEKLGLSLAPAEVGPALRLQYFNQPIGEFLHVAMQPIITWEGEPVIFVVANGGAGLILIGQKSSADTLMPTSAAFLFVRPQKVAKDQAPAAR